MRDRDGWLRYPLSSPLGRSAVAAKSVQSSLSLLYSTRTSNVTTCSLATDCGSTDYASDIAIGDNGIIVVNSAGIFFTIDFQPLGR